MNLQEVYKAIGGNYDDVMGRLRKETMVAKFVKRFLDESLMADLEQALAAGKVDEAFHAAHSLKGVCKNLSFDRLADSSSAITEELRAGKLEEAKALLPRVQEDYVLTCNAIRELE